MPTVSLDRADLFNALGSSYTEKELDELCFEYGLELDEWLEEGDERPTVKIEVPANRYDMLCLEGLSRALAVYLGKHDAPKYKVVVPDDPLVLTIHESVAKVRPYATGAILRGVKFTERRYNSFIALQDKLHSNLCRNRSLVAIGTHDLAKMHGNVHYRGVEPNKIKFRPLNQTREVSGSELIDFYQSDRNISKFLPLIQDKEVYPLFQDEKDQVLSLPPIINSDETKITLDTTDIFFDLTATDKTKLDIVVNQMVAMFSQYASEPFTIEAVKVVYQNEATFAPKMEPRTMDVEISYLNAVLGLDLDQKEYIKLFDRMMLSAQIIEKGLQVTIPATRPDILHPCDLVEDAGIAYSFNKLPTSFPGTSATIGKALPLNKIADIFRHEAAMAGWSEVMPLTLSSLEENFDWMRTPDDGTAVHLANPKTQEYQVVRTTLLPGLLKTIKENREHALPIKVFECGEVAFKDTSLERQSFNKRHLAAVFAGKTSGFETTQGLLDRLMNMLRYHLRAKQRGYWLEPTDSKTFFEGRGAKIILHPEGEEPRAIGRIGVLHPEVTQKFELPVVCSGFELDIAEFL